MHNESLRYAAALGGLYCSFSFLDPLYIHTNTVEEVVGGIGGLRRGTACKLVICR